MIQFNCEYCGKVLRTKDEKIGLHAQCPGCGADLVIPDSKDESLDEPEVVESVERRPCPMCGERVPVEAVTCRFCGERLKGKPRRFQAPHRGVLILVLGILSWAVCIVFGPVAWFLGTRDIKEMDAGRMNADGRTLTQVGRCIGLAHCVLFGVLIIFFVVMSAGEAIFDR